MLVVLRVKKKIPHFYAGLFIYRQATRVLMTVVFGYCEIALDVTRRTNAKFPPIAKSAIGPGGFYISNFQGSLLFNEKPGENLHKMFF
jgi:hypothetical protein